MITMKPENFVKEVKKSIVEENESLYRDLFENTNASEATDEYWKEALKLFSGLDDNGKEALFKIMRQVSVDTVSNLFGVLDGVSSLDGVDEEFKLSASDNENEIINGDLQDIFLELEELNS